MDEKTATRDAILAAAAKRFLHYGYGKTAMTEIAEDCSMSAGNIYRFFPAKIDIAEAMVRRTNEIARQAWSAIARDVSRSPEQRLRDFFLDRLERHYEAFTRHPKLLEISDVIARERGEYLLEEAAQERLIIERILVDGAQAGDFTLLRDAAFTADLVQCAVTKFRVSRMILREPHDFLVQELSGVLDLMMVGLGRR